MSKLTLAQANTIINAAIDAARASGGPPIAVVVVDDGGHVKAHQTCLCLNALLLKR